MLFVCAWEKEREQAWSTNDWLLDKHYVFVIVIKKGISKYGLYGRFVNVLVLFLSICSPLILRSLKTRAPRGLTSIYCCIQISGPCFVLRSANRRCCRERSVPAVGAVSLWLHCQSDGPTLPRLLLLSEFPPLPSPRGRAC